MKFGKLLALMLPLALVMVLAVACGGAEPQPAAPAGGITAEELQGAIAGIQIPEGLSEADVSEIVSSAMSAQPGITAADLQRQQYSLERDGRAAWDHRRGRQQDSR
jgi:hypothetical protein